jgi:CDP-diacylglycerol pyrophosphatase
MAAMIHRALRLSKEPGVGASVRVFALLALAAAVLCWAAGATVLDRNALLHIVHAQCLSHWRAQQDPAPCLQVTVPDPGGERAGYAVLPDRKGGAHFLLIPTHRLTGIESPALLEPDTTNYFAAAWEARSHMEQFLGRSLPRDAVGLAVNSRRSRGQDQLHIHIECLGPELKRQLSAVMWANDDRWHAVRLGRFRYQALEVPGEHLDPVDPFQRVARDLPGAADDMGAYTLLVAGWNFADRPGFIVLAADTAPGSETLLDSTCAVAR